jgi:hypothetical protein
MAGCLCFALDQGKRRSRAYIARMFEKHTRGRWLPIELAPENCDLEIGMAGKGGVAPCSFPGRRVSGIWFNVWTGEPVLVYPTHWRSWRR